MYHHVWVFFWGGAGDWFNSLMQVKHKLSTHSTTELFSNVASWVGCAQWRHRLLRSMWPVQVYVYAPKAPGMEKLGSGLSAMSTALNLIKGKARAEKPAHLVSGKTGPRVYCLMASSITWHSFLCLFTRSYYSSWGILKGIEWLWCLFQPCPKLLPHIII